MADPSSSQILATPQSAPRTLREDALVLDFALRQPSVQCILSACRDLVGLFDNLPPAPRPCLDDQLSLLNVVELAAINCIGITRHASAKSAVKATPEELTELEFALCWVMMAASMAVQQWGPGLPSMRFAALQTYIDGSPDTTPAEGLFDLPPTPTDDYLPLAGTTPHIHAPSPKYPISPRNLILPPTPTASPPPAYVPQSTSLGLIFPRGFAADSLALRGDTPTKARVASPDSLFGPPTPPLSSEDEDADAEGMESTPTRVRPLQRLAALRHPRFRMHARASPSPLARLDTP